MSARRGRPTPQARPGSADKSAMGSLDLDRRREPAGAVRCEPVVAVRREPVGAARRAMAAIAVVLAGVGAGAPAALAESRITVLAPQAAGGRGATASAGLRIELNVVRVLSLQAPTAAGSAAWSNGGTVMLGCAGQAACVSRASGAAGANVVHMPASGLTFAQP